MTGKDLARYKTKKKIPSEMWRPAPKHNKRTLGEPDSHACYKRQINLVDNFQWPGMWSHRLTGLLTAILPHHVQIKVRGVHFKKMKLYKSIEFRLQDGHSMNNDKTGVALLYYISWKCWRMRMKLRFARATRLVRTTALGNQ